MEEEREALSLRQKIKRSSINLSCCFHGRRFESFETPVDKPSPIRPPPPAWMRYRGRGRLGRHRRHFSDLSYDPLSYALNFDDGASTLTDGALDDEFRMRSFSRRLPRSPPERIPETARSVTSAPVSQEILVEIC